MAKLDTVHMNLPAFDLDRYLDRIGYCGGRATDLACLRALHWQHVSTIPFENLDIWLGRPIMLDLPAVARKLVYAGRGGYCFEQNRLFLAALQALGFEARALAARVWWSRTGDVFPLRTHMLLEVVCDGGKYLADVGFGSLTPPQPLEMRLGGEQATSHDTYRLVARGGETALEALLPEGWTTLYSFAGHTETLEDFGLGNWYVATHPTSFFTQSMIAVRPFADGRHVFQDGRSSRRVLGQPDEARQIADAAGLRALLAADFGLRLTGDEAEALWRRLQAG